MKNRRVLALGLVIVLGAVSYTHLEEPQSPGHRGSVEGDCQPAHGRIHQVYVQDGP